jgi:hypothetical protein
MVDFQWTAARIEGSIDSRVAFRRISANYSKICWPVGVSHGEVDPDFGDTADYLAIRPLHKRVSGFILHLARA